MELSVFSNQHSAIRYQLITLCYPFFPSSHLNKFHPLSLLTAIEGSVPSNECLAASSKLLS